MKWILLVLELLMLFAANNALFWLPGPYDWFNFVAAGVGICLAGLFGWLSSKRFAKSSSTGGEASWKRAIAAPPAVIWIFVMSLFFVVGLSKIVANLR